MGSWCNSTLNAPFPFITVWGKGQSEDLLLSQVSKQNPMFAVPVWPWSGSSEAGWGEAESQRWMVCGWRKGPLAPYLLVT